MTANLRAFYGLKFHPFRSDVPIDALRTTPAIEQFCQRVEFTVIDGGFALITGEPGTGKSVAMRMLAHRLGHHRDVTIGSLEHPQSRVADFYREMGELFGVPMQHHNRWGGFKALRQRWAEHVASTLMRPVLLIDEAQEMLSTVLSELRVLSSKAFDSRSLLCVIFAGDQRLTTRFRQPDLLPLGSRIRRRLHLDFADPDELKACLDHLLEAAGNPVLMTNGLKSTLAEHAAGNYRVLMNLAEELLCAGAERQCSQLDEKLFLDVFEPPARTKRQKTKTKR